MKTFIDNTPMLQNNFAATVSGPSNVCASGTSFTINYLPPVDSIIWTCGPNLSISSGQNTASCNLSVIGIGSSWVRARLVSACGSVTIPQKDVWVGNPASPVIVGNTLLTCNLYLYRVSDNSQVTWTVSGPLRISGTNYGYKCNINYRYW